MFLPCFTPRSCICFIRLSATDANKPFRACKKKTDVLPSAGSVFAANSSPSFLVGFLTRVPFHYQCMIAAGKQEEEEEKNIVTKTIRP